MPRPNKFQLPTSINKWATMALAAKAKVDLRTFQDYLSGRRKSKSETTRDAIEQVLRDAGHSDLIRERA